MPATVRGGAFLAQGLEVGGPYVVQIDHLGYTPVQQGDYYLAIGQRVEVQFVLEPAPIRLDTIQVVATRQSSFSEFTGTATTISDSLLRRLPTLNRDVYDFGRLVPQMSTRYGISGAGASLRFDAFLVDGASERSVRANTTIGGLGSGGGKAISVDAIKEYQVLLAPYDARYGDFAGAAVNAVTKSGTNERHGSAFAYTRNERLARNTPFLRDAPYDRTQLGFTAGGPIVRDRAHFFVSAEFQQMREPAEGPYVGQNVASPTRLPVFESDVAQFVTVLQGYGLDAGSGGRVTNDNPNANLFGRIDVALPGWKSRVVAHYNYATAEFTDFGRPAATGTFPLSSNAAVTGSGKRAGALQAFTQLPGSGLHELQVEYVSGTVNAEHYSLSPHIEVKVPGTVLNSGTLVAGPNDTYQGTGTRERSIAIDDHISMHPGVRHVLGIGARAELFSTTGVGQGGSFGTWVFSSLDSLERRQAESFRVQKDFGAPHELHGTQWSAYLNEEWQATDQLSITIGLRADGLALGTHPPYNPAVDSLFGRRTSDFPTSRVQWSPRFGFKWELGAEHRNQLRGGAGIFAVRPPMGWLFRPMRQNGAGVRVLSCSPAQGSASVPVFVPDVRQQPTTCANGRGFGDGAVQMVDRNLEMAQMFRASLAYDRELLWGIAASLEAIYSNTNADFLLANLNLSGPQGVDRHGRVLYGTIDLKGVAHPKPVSARFSEVLDLRNHSQGYSWALTARAERKFSDRFGAAASYTHSRVRDVQSLVLPSVVQARNSWASGRMMSGRHEDIGTGISLYDFPHRVVLAATWTSNVKRWATDLSVYYVGESGTPFTYNDSTASGGDLNADGTNANDPIYVPRNAADTSEIMFAGSTADQLRQQNAFERFIESSVCLRNQRGRILERNSCRGPWVHTANAALRQSLPPLHGHSASLELEVFNFLNLINRNWGQYRVPNGSILEQVGQTSGAGSQPVFRFDEARTSYSSQNVESAYQIQLALRYRF